MFIDHFYIYFVLKAYLPLNVFFSFRTYLQRKRNRFSLERHLKLRGCEGEATAQRWRGEEVGEVCCSESKLSFGEKDSC